MRRHGFSFVSILLSVCLCSSFFVPATTQPAGATQIATKQDANALKSEADKAYTAQDWSRAAALYGELTKAEPQSGFAWFRLGNALRRSQKYPEALAALEKAKALAFQPLITQAAIAGA